MNLCVVAFALVLGCTAPAEPPAPSAPRAAAADADRWLAEDKLRHFALSFAATQMGYGAARTAADRDVALPLAGAAALSAGLVKELRDARAGGPFSLRDLAWDAAGVALGIALARRIE